MNSLPNLLSASRWSARSVLMAASVVVSASSVMAQNTMTVKGTVRDANGDALIGVTVHVKGGNKGTITDINGTYTLSGVPRSSTLEFSYVGMTTQFVSLAGSKGQIDIVLRDDNKQLNQVVVTALGIKRSKKALGYAMQELKGSELLQTRESNVANALSGKVSGLQIIRSGNGPGASSKIQLRGSNSVTGLNQPLIVVDGIPMDNFTGAKNNDFWDPSADMGNGISDINSDDIASMSVLKGASAAALYGSRAGNGVILITTKSGRKTEGLGVTVSSSIATESIFMSPDMQNAFGQGDQGTYDANSQLSWGPKISGQEYTKWDGTKGHMKAYDNVKNYFNTGVNLTETIAFNQLYGKTAVYASLMRMDDRSKIPGAKQARTSLTARASAPLGQSDKLSLDTKVQYVHAVTNNRPISGSNMSNAFRTMYNMPRSLDVRDFESAISDPNGNKMLWYGKGQDVNPYWLSRYKLNEDVRDRFLLSASLKYKYSEWLSAELHAGSDMYFTDYDDRVHTGSPVKNSYSQSQDRFYEHNFSALVSAHKDQLLGKWGGAATFGGNLMMRQQKTVGGRVSILRVPDLFSLNNSTTQVNPIESISRKKINSIYGTAQINYDGYLFLEGTFRNDWSSTLSRANRSFFYPSISLSWGITDMFSHLGKHLPEWITYSKLRASYAEVGNDLEPYQLTNDYLIKPVPSDNTTTVARQDILFDDNVRSELIKSWEVGAELKLFDGRLGFDLSWYKSNATRQLLNLPMDNLSGYKSRKINAGDIQNTGVELQVTARPIELASGFSWDVNLNFSTNKNTVKELYHSKTDDIRYYSLGGYDNLQVYAVAGGNYGEIWGTSFRRVEDASSPYYGKMILENGLPTATTEKTKLGDQQANALVGLGSTLSYKGWSLNFLFDGRFGGHIFSGTLQSMQRAGTSAMTVVGDERPKMVVDGVTLKDGKYIPNTQEVTAQQYWKATAGNGNIGVGELNIYDATNIRLRTLSLSYTMGRKMLQKTPFQSIKLSASCSNVWMLKSHMHGIDPESVFATSTNATGFEYGSAPTSRTCTFNVSLSF